METSLHFEEIACNADITHEILVVKWSPDDQLIALSTSSSSIIVLDPHGLHVSCLLSLKSMTTMPFTGISWFPTEVEVSTSLIGISSDSRLGLWNAAGGNLEKYARLPIEQALCCEISPNGRALAIGSSTAEVLVIKTDTFAVERLLPAAKSNNKGHDNRVFAVKWVNNEILLSGGWDGLILMWDVYSASVGKSFFKANLHGSAIDIKGNLMLLGSYDRANQLQVHNYVAGTVEKIETLEEDSKIYGAQFSKSDSGNTFCMVGTKIRLYDTDTYQALDSIEESGANWLSCDWAHHANILAVGSSRGVVKLFCIC